MKRKYFQIPLGRSKKNLKKAFGRNKIFLPDIEVPALIALSYFPELKNTRIEFTRCKIRTTMEVHPDVKSLWGARSQIKYIIFVNDQIQNGQGILIDDVPFNAQIGLIAHELAHIVDYQKLNLIQLFEVAVNYHQSGFRRKLERHTDLEVIRRGLGWQLYEWARYAMFESSAGQAYKEFKKRYYLRPKEIMRILKKGILPL